MTQMIKNEMHNIMNMDFLNIDFSYIAIDLNYILLKFNTTQGIIQSSISKFEYIGAIFM